MSAAFTEKCITRRSGSGGALALTNTLVVAQPVAVALCARCAGGMEKAGTAFLVAERGEDEPLVAQGQRNLRGGGQSRNTHSLINLGERISSARQSAFCGDIGGGLHLLSEQRFGKLGACDGQACLPFGGRWPSTHLPLGRHGR